MSNAVNSKLSFSISSCALALGVIVAVAGCSGINDLLEPEKIDYKSATKPSKNSKLEVPPDLTPLKSDSRYAVENVKGSATASEYSAQRAAAAPAAAGKAAAPTVEGKVAPAANSAAGLRVERDGTQRWLVSTDAPEVLWPRIKEFWQENGFLVAIENAEAGVMETDWAENRAKIPRDFIRNAIGKVLDSLYSTGERDKFRTRLERRPGGGTEIYISHRGAEEKVTGQAVTAQNIIWTSRPADPELEAEFIARLMAALGSDATVAKAAVKDAKLTPVQQRSQIVKEGRANVVEVDEGFDRAWRRVGLALDRVGFTVEDRDRARGIYFVRYIDPESDAKKGEKGFFARMFSSKDEKTQAVRYQILVKAAGERSRVSVQDDKGALASDATATRILTLLNEQLK